MIPAIGPELEHRATAIGHNSCAIGDQALAVGADGIGVACQCGLWLQGHAQPGRASIEAAQIYLAHADVCDRVNPLAVASAEAILTGEMEGRTP